MSDASVKSTGE